MSESLEQKQNKVKEAINKCIKLDKNKYPFSGKLPQESKMMYNYKEAREIFGEHFVDKILKESSKHFRTGSSNKDFYGDCLAYAIIVYISQNLNEPFDKYLKDFKYVMHLEGAFLENVDFTKCKLIYAKFNYGHLNNVIFSFSEMQFVSFNNSCLDTVRFVDVDLSCATFVNVIFRSTDAYIESIYKVEPRNPNNICLMKNCTMINVNMQNVDADKLVLEDIDGYNININNGLFVDCKFLNVDFENASINNKTGFIQDCTFNSMVNFKNVDLSVLADEEICSMLEYSTKRLKWERKLTCKKTEHNNIKEYFVNCFDRLGKSITKLFWYCSDFGYSTKRIIWSFLIVSLFFAVIYWTMGAVDFLMLGAKDSCWGCVANLFQAQDKSFVFLPFGIHGIFRTLYFSIVTMTTLGFGDVYADPNSLLGYVLLSWQVIMGYILLGLLITRVSVLFICKDIPVVPPLAEKHKEGDARIKWFLFKFGVLTLGLLMFLKIGYDVFRRYNI